MMPFGLFPFCRGFACRFFTKIFFLFFCLFLTAYAYAEPAFSKQNADMRDISAEKADGAFSHMPPADYNPPEDVPIPQPKLIPNASANIAVPFPEIMGQSDGRYQSPEQTEQETGGSGTAQIGLEKAQEMAQILADKFSQIRMMMGNFVQFDARGGVSTGAFYLERPGKILFDYKDTPLRVICDGRNIAVNNRRLRSWNLYDLSKSPLSLLLSDKINIANGRLLEFTQEPSATTLVLGDATGHSKIMLIFDAKTYGLKQWTMTENGQDTTVQIMNVKTDIEFTKNMFNIDYYRFPGKSDK